VLPIERLFCPPTRLRLIGKKMAFQKIILFLVVPICLSIPFFYFNRWLIGKLKPAEALRKMLLYYIIILPIAFVLVTVCIYVIVRGYLLMKKD